MMGVDSTWGGVREGGREEVHREMQLGGERGGWRVCGTDSNIQGASLLCEAASLALQACACPRGERKPRSNVVPEGQRGMHAFWAAHAGRLTPTSRWARGCRGEGWGV